MVDPGMMADRQVLSDRHENGSSILPLPLNLIALIISHVSLELPFSTGSNATDLRRSSMTRQTSVACAGHAAFSIT